MMEGFMFSTPMIISSVEVEHRVGDADDLIETSAARDLFISEPEPMLEPYEGMEFDSEEAAREFYHAYASQIGFKVRVSSFIRSKRDKSIISRQLVCSREGFRSMKDTSDDGRAKRPRIITRVGCRAMIMVKKQSSGRWVVSKCEKIHNHLLGTHGKVVMLDFDPYLCEGEVTENPLSKDSSLNGTFAGNCDGMEVVPPEGYPHREPLEGMEFESEQDAQAFYKEYARQIGFRARVSSYYRSKRDNSIISRLIVCSKEGFRAKKDEGAEERLHRPRAPTRTGCKAMIMVKKRGSGRWVVSKLVKNHNHLLSPRTASEDECSEAEDEQMLELEKVQNVHGYGILEPYDGMEFESEEAARMFYLAYSRCMGFNMRVSTYYRSKRDKSIISRLFVCSKEGFYMKKDSCYKGNVKRPREATRVGCKAMLMVKKSNSKKWFVSKFEKEHNHPLGKLRRIKRPQKRKHSCNNAKVADDQGRLQCSNQESPLSRYQNLFCETFKYAEAGSESAGVYNVAVHALREAVMKVAAIKKNGNLNLGTVLNEGIIEGSSNQDKPEGVLPLGQYSDANSQTLTYQQQLSLDRPSGKLNCSFCKQSGDHTSQTCPIKQLNIITDAPVNMVADESISELFQ